MTILNEMDINISDLSKYASLIGISVFALKKIFDKHKKDKIMQQFGQKSKVSKLSPTDIQDLLINLGEAPFKFGGK